MNGSHPQLINYSSFVNGLNHQTMMLFLPFVTIPVFVLCYVWIFHAPCDLSFPVFCPLSPSVCQPCSLLVFSSVLLPFVTTPDFLPPLSPHLFLIGNQCLCIQSVCFLHSWSGHCMYSFWLLLFVLSFKWSSLFFLSPDLASCLTAFGSTSPFILSFPLKT